MTQATQLPGQPSIVEAEYRLDRQYLLHELPSEVARLASGRHERPIPNPPDMYYDSGASLRTRLLSSLTDEEAQTLLIRAGWLTGDDLPTLSDGAKAFELVRPTIGPDDNTLLADGILIQMGRFSLMLWANGTVLANRYDADLNAGVGVGFNAWGIVTYLSELGIRFGEPFLYNPQHVIIHIE